MAPKVLSAFEFRRRRVGSGGQTQISPAPGERGALNAVMSGCSGFDDADLKTFVLGRLLEDAIEMSHSVRVEDVSAGDCLESRMFDFRDRCLRPAHVHSPTRSDRSSQPNRG